MYGKNKPSWAKHWDFLLIDLLALAAAFFISYGLYHERVSQYWESFYQMEFVILILVDLLTLLIREPFHGVLRRGYLLEFGNTFQQVVTVMLGNLVFLFITHQINVASRVFMVLTALIYFCLSYAGRFIRKKQLKRTSERREKSSLVIITTEELAEEVLRDLAARNSRDYFVQKIILVGETSGTGSIGGSLILPRNEDPIDYFCHTWVDEVLIRVPGYSSIPKELLTGLSQMGLIVHFCIAKEGEYGSSVQSVEHFGQYTVLTTGMRAVPFRQILAKRVMDIAGGIVGCLITLVLTVIIGPMIWIKSPGPIFFTQIRVGRNGKKFRMYKFRSMYPDAEQRKKALQERNEMQGLMFKIKDDPRIIGSEKKDRYGRPAGIGNFIRRTSIDEFPQFFNVLKGDMSIVGTRPPTVDEWEQYDPGLRARMSIKPGITGLWQVSGRSEITDFREVVRLDVEYIQNWSIGYDIKLILRTIGVVLKNKGAE